MKKKRRRLPSTEIYPPAHDPPPPHPGCIPQQQQCLFKMNCDCDCLAMKEKEVEGSPVLRGSLICEIVDLDPKNPSSYLPSPALFIKTSWVENMTRCKGVGGWEKALHTRSCSGCWWCWRIHPRRSARRQQLQFVGRSRKVTVHRRKVTFLDLRKRGKYPVPLSH